MSLYDAAKDAVKIAQKADNIELIQKLLDVQEQALETQEKQFQLYQVIAEKDSEIKKLKETGELVLDGKHTWLIVRDDPDHKYCPVCARRDGFKSPLEGGYGEARDQYLCHVCKGAYV